MSDPLPVPYDSGMLGVTVLGFIPEIHRGWHCLTCGDELLITYIGYSTATTVLGVERGGLCVSCETLMLRGEGGDEFSIDLVDEPGQDDWDF